MRCPSCGYEATDASDTESACLQCGRGLVPAVARRPEPSPALRAHAVSPPAPPDASSSVTSAPPPEPSPSPAASHPPLPAEYAALLRAPIAAQPEQRAWQALAEGPAPRPRPTRAGGWGGVFSRQTLLAALLLGLVAAGLAYTAGNLAKSRGGAGGPGALTAPQATPTATAARTASGETILYRNPLDASTSGWEHQDGCRFRDDGLHVTDGFACFAPIPQQGDVHIVAMIKQISGPNDRWNDIVLRGTFADNAYLMSYEFGVEADGHWGFDKFTKDSRVSTPLVRKMGGVRAGLNQANTLEIIAKGTHFEFWINGAKVGAFDDATYSFGSVGLAGEEGDEAVFTGLTISRPM